MAVHYVIDGYNLLYALPEMPAGSWQEKRAHLIEFLKERRPQGKNSVTIVFDSREGQGDQAKSGDLHIRYTAGETADDRIGVLVREHPQPRTLVVVSNDLGIRELVRGTGAKFITATEFLKNASPKPPPGHTSRRRNPDDEKEITEEFKEKWL